MLRRLAFLTLLPSLLLSGLLLSGSALAASGTVTVRKGDTLFAIAQRSGVPVTRLRAINGLKGNLIHPGQKLRLSGKGPPAANPPPSPPVPGPSSIRCAPETRFPRSPPAWGSAWRP